LGSVVGPHPFPTMNRDFQSVVGREIRSQLFDREKILPDYVIACVGGGSNAMGAFTDFILEKNVILIGVEAGGRGEKLEIMQYVFQMEKLELLKDTNHIFCKIVMDNYNKHTVSRQDLIIQVSDQS